MIPVFTRILTPHPDLEIKRLARSNRLLPLPDHIYIIIRMSRRPFMFGRRIIQPLLVDIFDLAVGTGGKGDLGNSLEDGMQLHSTFLKLSFYLFPEFDLTAQTRLNTV